MSITGSLLVSIYSPNAAYKTKWIGAEKVKNRSLHDSNMKYTYSEGNCVSIPTDYIMNTIMTVMVYVDFIISALLPFTIMIVCNAIIIHKLIKNKKITKNIKSTGIGPDLVNLTTTLLVVSFTYIILTSPSAILVIGWNYFGITSGHSTDTVKLWRSFAKLFLVMNNALNFLQYVCTGKRFRTASKDLFTELLNNIAKVSPNCKKSTPDSTIEMQVIDQSL